MPFTSASIALVWIVALSIFIFVASGARSGPWLVLAVLAALAAPALLRRSRVAPDVPAGVNGAIPATTVTHELKGLAGEVLRWEDEGGAAGTPGLGAPVSVVP